jgi:GWxTD domain-containing protein
MKKFIISAGIILSCWIQQTVAQVDFIPLQVDYACFKGSGKTYIEIYLSFAQSSLIYSPKDSQYVAHFDQVIEIKQEDSVVQSIQRNYKNAVINQHEIDRTYQNQFIDVFAVELVPGIYQLLAAVHDQTSQKMGDYSLELTVPAFDKEFKVSNLQLSTRIEKTERKSNYSAKNNIEIMPNPSCTFGLGSPMLYFYFEVYNLKIDSVGNNKYSYHYYITDTEGKRVRDYPEKTKSNNTNTVAEASGSNVITLKSDTYYLNLEVADLLANTSSAIRKKFTINKPAKQTGEMQGEGPLAASDEYLNFTEKDLKAEFERAVYIALPEEKKIFANLDLEGMKKFLTEFWKRRDPDPSTPFNEFKRTYIDNLNLANSQFSSNFKEGWRTDQGRVLLIYGRPDEIERNPNSISTQPYEIWHYYSLEGGSEFIFGDLSGNGYFELLHSTYRNEIKDYNWQSRLGGSRSSSSSPGYSN